MHVGIVIGSNCPALKIKRGQSIMLLFKLLPMFQSRLKEALAIRREKQLPVEAADVYTRDEVVEGGCGL